MDMAKGDTIMQCSSLEEVRSNIDRIDNEIIKTDSREGELCDSGF